MSKLKKWNEIRRINSRISAVESELMKEQRPTSTYNGVIGILNVMPIPATRHVFRETERATFLRDELNSLHSQKAKLKLV